MERTNRAGRYCQKHNNKKAKLNERISSRKMAGLVLLIVA